MQGHILAQNESSLNFTPDVFKEQAKLRREIKIVAWSMDMCSVSVGGVRGL